MGLRKCPKCEINYIRDDQELCEVCSRKHKLREHDEEENDVVLCAECGERPAMKGKELCKRCYAERTMGERPAKKAVSNDKNFDDDEINEDDDETAFIDDETDDEIDDDMDDDLDDEIDGPDMLDDEDSEFDEEKVNYVLSDNYNNSIYPDD